MTSPNGYMPQQATYQQSTYQQPTYQQPTNQPLAYQPAPSGSEARGGGSAVGVRVLGILGAALAAAGFFLPFIYSYSYLDYCREFDGMADGYAIPATMVLTIVLLCIPRVGSSIAAIVTSTIGFSVVAELVFRVQIYDGISDLNPKAGFFLLVIGVVLALIGAVGAAGVMSKRHAAVSNAPDEPLQASEAQPYQAPQGQPQPYQAPEASQYQASETPEYQTPQYQTPSDADSAYSQYSRGYQDPQSAPVYQNPQSTQYPQNPQSW